MGIGTVSRVLNDSAGVAEATRVRVRAVMDELGYRPSATARNLSLGRTQALGVIAPFFTSPSVVERLRGIDDVVGRSAYDLTLFNIETLDQRRAALRRFARRDRVDGVIVISLPLRPAEVRALHRDGVPTELTRAVAEDYGRSMWWWFGMLANNLSSIEPRDDRGRALFAAMAGRISVAAADHG